MKYLDRPPPSFETDDIRKGSRPGSYPPIVLDEMHFLISRADFDQLPEYNTSRPSGVYDGKCWKFNRSGVWWIACYIEEVPPHPDGMLTPKRKALIVEDDE